MNYPTQTPKSNSEQQVPQGFKMTKLGVIPEDWEIVRFDQVASIDQETLSSSTDPTFEFKYVSLSDIESGQSIKTVKYNFRDAPSRARRVVREGDILMSTVRPNLKGFTIIDRVEKELIASTGFAVISTNDCFNQYMFHYIFSQNLDRQFHYLLVGSNYPAINSSDVSQLKLVLPPLPEQRAIAACLGTWDHGIETLTQLIAQKEQRKKGLMQQLLTGKKRLPEFVGEWEEKRLGEFIQLTPRQVVKPSSNYLALGIRSHGKGVFRKPNTSPMENTMDVLYEVRTDDLIVNITFAWEGAIAIATQEHHGGLVSHRFPTYTFSKTHASADFFRHLILTPRMKYFLNLISPGGAGRNRVLKKSDFLKLEFNIPAIEEQKAIAQVLQSADNELKLLNLQLDQLRDQKKGLMQQLLTGKRRLTLNER